MPGPKRSKQKFPHEVVETVEDIGTQTLVETLPAETAFGLFRDDASSWSRDPTPTLLKGLI
jgi:hypothetical protein